MSMGVAGTEEVGVAGAEVVGVAGAEVVSVVGTEVVGVVTVSTVPPRGQSGELMVSSLVVQLGSTLILKESTVRKACSVLIQLCISSTRPKAL